MPSWCMMTLHVCETALNGTRTPFACSLALNLHLATCHSHSYCLDAKGGTDGGARALRRLRRRRRRLWMPRVERAEECQIKAEIVRRKFSQT